MKTVRLWKLGILDGMNSIMPTKEAIENLRKAIEAEDNKGGGTLDIIWGPDLELEIFGLDDNGNLSKC